MIHLSYDILAIIHNFKWILKLICKWKQLGIVLSLFFGLIDDCNDNMLMNGLNNQTIIQCFIDLW